MSTIDLSQLPPPDVLEALDFEALYQEILSQFRVLMGTAWDANLESDPVVKLLELAAYREIILRARINDAARACMLAYATGNDLDHLSALIGVARLENDAGDREEDDRLRLRTQMALEGETVAGSSGSYIFHALSASPLVKDVAIDSPVPGVVRTTVLSTEGMGIPSDELLLLLSAYLSADDRRPLTDSVRVEPAEIVSFEVIATLNVYPGPAAAPILVIARAAVQKYVAEHAKLGHDITLSGIYACLHQPGVQRVVLESPAVDIVIAPRQAAHCATIEITLGATDV